MGSKRRSFKFIAPKVSLKCQQAGWFLVQLDWPIVHTSIEFCEDIPLIPKHIFHVLFYIWIHFSVSENALIPYEKCVPCVKLSLGNLPLHLWKTYMFCILFLHTKFSTKSLFHMWMGNLCAKMFGFHTRNENIAYILITYPVFTCQMTHEIFVRLLHLWFL